MLDHRILRCGFVVLGLAFVVRGAAAEGTAVLGKLDGADVAAGAALEVPGGATRDLALGDDVHVFVHGGSSAVLARSQYFPPESGTKSVKGTLVVLREGELTIRMPDDTTKPRAVSVMSRASAQTVLAWRGTTRVVVRDGAMSVAVDEGAAYVGAEEKWLRIAAGGAAIMPKKEGPHAVKTRLAAPTFGAGALAFAAGSEAAPVTFAWSGQPEAERYRVEVLADGGARVATSLETEAAHPSVSTKLPAGSYQARIVGYGKDGVPGFSSRPMPVTVKRFELPDGAVLARDGVVVLPPRATLTLDPAARFDIASAGGRDVDEAVKNVLFRPFYPGVAQLRLDGADARAVRVRDGSGAVGQVLLARRELRAKVVMGPARARWPEVPIDVSVTLESAGGRLDASKEEVALEVKVDTQPVKVDWAREGATLRARIPPHEGPGPWLVSVVVKDAAHAEIGSRVMDLDGSRPLALRLPEAERAPKQSVVYARSQ